VAKKPNFPTKSCPKCGKPIHARLTKHEACGWVAEANGKPAPTATKTVKRRKLGRPRKAIASAGGISLDDIAAVKAVVDRLGAEKVRDLAAVLAK